MFLLCRESTAAAGEEPCPQRIGQAMDRGREPALYQGTAAPRQELLQDSSRVLAGEGNRGSDHLLLSLEEDAWRIGEPAPGPSPPTKCAPPCQVHQRGQRRGRWEKEGDQQCQRGRGQRRGGQRGAAEPLPLPPLLCHSQQGLAPRRQGYEAALHGLSLIL